MNYFHEHNPRIRRSDENWERNMKSQLILLVNDLTDDEALIVTAYAKRLIEVRPEPENKTESLPNNGLPQHTSVIVG